MVSFDPRTEQFLKELPQAQKGEAYVAKILNGRLSKPGDKDCDVVLSDGYGVEVKYDKLSKKTGRVAIEYMAYKNETGIKRSGAYYYFVICYDRDWSEIVDGLKYNGWWIGIMIKKDTLLQMIDFKPYRDVNGGDNRATKMKLIPVAEIREASERIFPIKHSSL